MLWLWIVLCSSFIKFQHFFFLMLRLVTPLTCCLFQSLDSHTHSIYFIHALLSITRLVSEQKHITDLMHMLSNCNDVLLWYKLQPVTYWIHDQQGLLRLSSPFWSVHVHNSPITRGNVTLLISYLTLGLTHDSSQLWYLLHVFYVVRTLVDISWSVFVFWLWPIESFGGCW